MKKKKLSSTVIIPAYDAAWCLGECVASISKQTVKPTVVMIGVDCCQSTLAKAMEIQREHANADRRKKGMLKIEVIYFESRCYPYRIRNTLAATAHTDILHFFDADDIMYRNHLEMMTKPLIDGPTLGPDGEQYKGVYLTAMAEMQEGEKPKIKWDRAHGVVSIMRRTFLATGGYEPWRCAADTEAVERWKRLRLLRCRPKEPTMLVRKHDGSLTIGEQTGYQSECRKAYREEIKRRMLADQAYTLRTISIADPDDYGPIPEDTIITPPQENTAEESAVDQALTDAMTALRYMMAVHGQGHSRQGRKAYKMASAVVNPQA